MKNLGQFGVVGNPIAQSLSPTIHPLFAHQFQSHISYQAYCPEVSQFSALIHELCQQGLVGVNVTAPFKLEAFELAHQPSQRAILAGAANVLHFVRQGSEVIIKADNTDGIGLVRDILRQTYERSIMQSHGTQSHENSDWTIHNQSILIVGAGGATRGIIQPILEQKPKRIVIANRTPEKAAELVRYFKTQLPELSTHTLFEACGMQDLNKERAFDGIINASSFSLSQSRLDLPLSLMDAMTWVYDLSYTKGRTPFLHWAAQVSSNWADGKGMLVEQAAESFYIWTGLRPETQRVLKGMMLSMDRIATQNATH